MIKIIKPFLLVISGPAGIGKTTLAEAVRLKFENRPVMICLDNLAFDPPRDDLPRNIILDRARDRGLELLSDYLNRAESVIIEKAFCRYEYVYPFLKEAKKRGVPYLYVKLSAPLETVLQRNESREKKLRTEKVERIYKEAQEFRHDEGLEIDASVADVETLTKIVIENLTDEIGRSD